KCMHNLAGSYRAAGDIERGLQLSKETLEVKKARFGPNHPDTLVTMINVASSYAAAGHIPDALELYEETLSRYTDEVGPDHPQTILCRNNLAYFYTKTGRAAKARQILQEALDSRESRGKGEPNNNREQSLLASTHSLLGEAKQVQLDFTGALLAH